jgi:hypothetical protein
MDGPPNMKLYVTFTSPYARLARHKTKRLLWIGGGSPERHAAAPQPIFSGAALTAFLVAPAVAVSKAFLRSRAGPKAMLKFDPESDS